MPRGDLALRRNGSRNLVVYRTPNHTRANVPLHPGQILSSRRIANAHVHVSSPCLSQRPTKRREGSTADCIDVDRMRVRLCMVCRRGSPAVERKKWFGSRVRNGLSSRSGRG